MNVLEPRVAAAALGQYLLYIFHSLSNIPLRRVASFFGEGNGTPLQYSCLENPMDCSLPGSSIHKSI